MNSGALCELIPAALELNHNVRRSEMTANILRLYRLSLKKATQGREMTPTEAFDFSQGAYLGLMIAEALIRGTDDPWLQALVGTVGGE